MATVSDYNMISIVTIDHQALAKSPGFFIALLLIRDMLNYPNISVQYLYRYIFLSLILSTVPLPEVLRQKKAVFLYPSAGPH